MARVQAGRKDSTVEPIIEPNPGLALNLMYDNLVLPVGKLYPVINPVLRMYIIVIVILKLPVLAAVRHRQGNLEYTNPVRLHQSSPGKDEKHLHLAPRNNSRLGGI